jgi:hypothetical protein
MFKNVRLTLKYLVVNVFRGPVSLVLVMRLE